MVLKWFYFFFFKVFEIKTTKIEIGFKFLSLDRPIIDVFIIFGIVIAFIDDSDIYYLYLGVKILSALLLLINFY
jgi:hypothetical protein